MVIKTIIKNLYNTVRLSVCVCVRDITQHNHSIMFVHASSQIHLYALIVETLVL